MLNRLKKFFQQLNIFIFFRPLVKNKSTKLYQSNKQGETCKILIFLFFLFLRGFGWILREILFNSRYNIEEYLSFLNVINTFLLVLLVIAAYTNLFLTVKNRKNETLTTPQLARKKSVFLKVIFNLKKHLHNLLQLVILVGFNKFKWKIKELKS